MATTFAGHLLTGTHASRPAATAVPAGTLYSCTTHALIYQSDGATWATYATLGSTETLAASIIDAKGDLIGGTAADTAARLAVGSNTQVLTADSAETTGMKWATPSAAAGALTQLYDLTASAGGTFDQASISGSYNDLFLVMIVRGATSAATDTLQLRFNNDSAGNYYRQFLRGAGATAAANEALGQTSAALTINAPAATATANYYAHLTAEILGYASTSWVKVITAISGADKGKTTGLLTAEIHTTVWDSTAAISRIQLLAISGGGFAAGSKLRIYGRT